MSIEAIKEQISEQALTREEQIRLLRKIRCALLEEIHCKQQRLDQIDYLIYKLKKGGNLMNELEYGTIFEKGIPNPFGKFFVGNSYLSMLTQLNGVGVANVTFEPGCRNNWHVHHGDKGGGQILLVTGGRGWYQEWGKEAQELHAGDVVAIPTGVKHWHGAAWDSWFAHVAIEIPGENTSNEWLEPVSEEDYNKLR